MRHFLALGPAAAAVAGLPRGVVQPPAAAGRNRRPAARTGACRAHWAQDASSSDRPDPVAAEEEDPAAVGPSADHKPKGIQASPRTGRRAGQSRGCAITERADRAPLGFSPRARGGETPGPHPLTPSAGLLYLRAPSTATSQQSRGRPGPRCNRSCLGFSVLLTLVFTRDKKCIARWRSRGGCAPAWILTCLPGASVGPPVGCQFGSLSTTARGNLRETEKDAEADREQKGPVHCGKCGTVTPSSPIQNSALSGDHQHSRALRDGARACPLPLARHRQQRGRCPTRWPGAR